MPIDFDLAGKRALVTGGSRGIGRSIALALADAGADVAVTSRTGRAGNPVADEIRHRGHRTLSLLLDVRHLVSIRACFDRLDSEWGPLDILVNNAGTNVPRAIFDVGEEDWDLVVDTNLKGLFFVAQAAARRMVDAKKPGRIVNIASQYGLVANVERVSYAASKGGVVNLTKALALELAPHQITVNAIAPTTIDTELMRSQLEDPSFRERTLANIPLGELAKPEDVASAAVFLASPAASMITGHTLVVDGGWTAQ
jgi:2-deoxy-D-gluconate 3-dehydrogenase